MAKHLLPLLSFLVTLQVLAIDTHVPELHWTLPTTLDGIRREREQMKVSEEPAPVSIMCRNLSGSMTVSPEATKVTEGERYWTVKRDLTLASVPYIALGFATRPVKRDVRKVNHDINKGFHNKADDYIQYAPLAFTWILKATGYEGRSKWGRMLVSNALSGAIMAGIVNTIKYTAAEMRPDGSSRNSFPSGHTATAFMAATILHKEYGLTRSPWFSVGGYAVATGIGVFRVMNNRHWVSDVMTGAGIGILSTELGYAVSDLIFKDKHTLRRELEGLNDLNEHPSFLSLQAGIGIVMSTQGIPDEITAAGGPTGIKKGIGTVIGAEAAYFLNPYLGFGLRARIISTAVTPRWNGTDHVWTSGLLHYNAATDQYERPVADFRYGTDMRRDQMSSFDLMGGVYGQLPLNKRMSLGGKILFGHRRNGSVWYLADMTGNDTDNMMKPEDLLSEITKVEQRQDITTYDHVKGIYLDGKGSFIFGTGFNFSYALKHNIVWRVGIDYDFTRARYDYWFQNVSLVDEANAYLAALRNGDKGNDMTRGLEGSFSRNLHQLTPIFGICFSF